MSLAPLAAAAVMNASTWLAAILVGHTRQLMASWAVLACALFSFCLTSGFSWARDLNTLGALSLMVLGLPVSLGFLLLPTSLTPPPGHAVILALGVLDLLVLPYLQAFVLLPRFFQRQRRWTGA